MNRPSGNAERQVEREVEKRRQAGACDSRRAAVDDNRERGIVWYGMIWYDMVYVKERGSRRNVVLLRYQIIPFRPGDYFGLVISAVTPLVRTSRGRVAEYVLIRKRSSNGGGLQAIAHLQASIIAARR